MTVAPIAAVGSASWKDPGPHPQRPRASASTNAAMRPRVSSVIQLARTFASTSAPASITARAGWCSCRLVAAYAAGEY